MPNITTNHAITYTNCADVWLLDKLTTSSQISGAVFSPKRASPKNQVTLLRQLACSIVNPGLRLTWL